MKWTFTCFLIFSLEWVSAQTINGVSLSGVTLGLDAETASDLNNGLLTVWKPDQGVQLNGTNVIVWNDALGRNFPWAAYQTTNQPSACLFGTNLLGQSMSCIYFETNAAHAGTRLVCDKIATNFFGVNKPFTLIFTINSQIVQANATAQSFGFVNATNSGADRWGLRDQNGSGQAAYFKGCATNQTPPSALLSAGNSPPTNAWAFIGIVFDGTTLTIWNNIALRGTLNTANQTLTELDTATLGMLGHQGAYTLPWRGAIGEMPWYTNALTGLQYTNKLNAMNARLHIY